MSSRPWSDSTKRAVVLSLLILFALAAYRFRALIPPLSLAILIAYVLAPVVDSLKVRYGVPRSIGVLLADALALLVAGIIPVAVAPRFLAQIREFNVETSDIITRVSHTVADLLRSTLGLETSAYELADQAQAMLSQSTDRLLTGSLFLLLDVASALIWIIFVFAVSFYLMRDWHHVTRYLHEVVPPGYRQDYAYLIGEIGAVWQSFFRGQLILSGVVGLAVGISMAILGVPNALALGLLAGLLEVVPNFGPVISAIPAVAIALFQGSSWLDLSNVWFALLVAGVYTLIQQVENNYLAPRIIGRSVQLHPLVVLVGAIAGARLAGVLGIFLAAPVLASLRIILSYIYAKLLDNNWVVANGTVAGGVVSTPRVTPFVRACNLVVGAARRAVGRDEE